MLEKSSSFPLVADDNAQSIKLEDMSHSTLSRDDMDVAMEGTQADLSKAQEWVNDVLICHSRLFTRANYAQLLQSAVTKELLGAKERWTEVEKFYMILTDPEVPDPKQRIYGAVAMAQDCKLAERLENIRSIAKQRYEAQQRTSKLDGDMNDIRIKIAEQTRDIKIDHFACAIPLASLASHPDVIDENEGACPVCQNSYTDLSLNTVPELLADAPVRIKYCGHIIGKACLEQWMSTPKIDQAKYPHRTCPLCRVKIEGTTPPSPPAGLRAHVKTDRRATETLKELVYGWDMDLTECLETITKNMSEEIACEEVLNLLNGLPEKAMQGYDSDTKLLQEKMGKLKAERRVWGFKGNLVWMQLRDEWMKSGIVSAS